MGGFGVHTTCLSGEKNGGNDNTHPESPKIIAKTKNKKIKKLCRTNEKPLTIYPPF
jgi:hypothetical protein